MPKNRRRGSQKTQEKRSAGNVAARSPMDCSPTNDPSHKYEKDSLSKEQKESPSEEQRDSSAKKRNNSLSKKRKDSSSKDHKDLSSKEQKDLLPKDQKDSSSKEQKDSSSKDQKDSSSKDQKDSSSEEQKDSLPKEQKDSSSKDQKNSSSKEQKELLSKEQKDSSSKDQKDPSSEEQKDSSSKEQKDSASKEQKDSSSKEQKDSASKEQKDSASKEQKDSSSKEQKDSASKEQKDSSSKEQKDSASNEQKDSSSKEQKDSSSEEQNDSSSKEQKDSASKEQKDSSSKEQKDSSSKEQTDSLSTRKKNSSSKKQKHSSPKEQKNPAPNEASIHNEISWKEIVEVRHWLEKPHKPAVEKDPANRGEHIINNGVLKIYRDVVEEFVKDIFGVNLSHLENNVLSEDSSVLQAIREPVSQDVMHQIANVMVVHLQKSYTDSNAKAFGEKIDVLKGPLVGYMGLLYNPPNSPNLTGLERNIVYLVEDFIGGGFFVDYGALDIWRKRGNSLQAFKLAREEVKSMLRRLIPHGLDNILADWVNELRQRRLICFGIHNISRDVVQEFVTDVLGRNLNLSDLENKTLSKNSRVLRAIRELDAPEVMHLLCKKLVVRVRHEDSYQNYDVAWKMQKVKKILVAHMKSIYSGHPNQKDLEFVEDFITNKDYVDKDALRIWLGNGNSSEYFKEASGRVGSMLRRMVPCGRNDLLAIWVKELRNAAERLLEQRK